MHGATHSIQYGTSPVHRILRSNLNLPVRVSVTIRVDCLLLTAKIVLPVVVSPQYSKCPEAQCIVNSNSQEYHTMNSEPPNLLGEDPKIITMTTASLRPLHCSPLFGDISLLLFGFPPVRTLRTSWWCDIRKHILPRINGKASQGDSLLEFECMLSSYGLTLCNWDIAPAKRLPASSRFLNWWRYEQKSIPYRL